MKQRTRRRRLPAFRDVPRGTEWILPTASAFLIIFPASSLGQVAAARDGATPDARAIGERALDAMGGESLLRDLRVLRLEGLRRERSLGIATDPEVAPEFSGRFTELRNISDEVATRSIEAMMERRPDPLSFTTTVAAATSSEAAEELRGAPESIVLAAVDADDLRWSGVAYMAGEAYDIVTFGEPLIKLYLSRRTGLPWGWKSVRAYPDDRFVWRLWGDVETRIRWHGWTLEPSGLRYPRLHATFRNGALYRNITVTRIEVNPQVEAGSLPTADQVQPRPEAEIGADAREIVPGVAFLPGSFNVVLVEHDDGIVILEAPESAAYSRLVLAEAEKRFPGVPVKAVVSASGAWPHIAGIREYVARGIPIYTAAPNVERIERVASAPRRLVPDSLQRAPRTPDVRPVLDATTLGHGERSIRLLPITGTVSPRTAEALLAYIPGPDILYASDVFVPRRFEPTFWRQVMYDLTGAVDRWDLSPALALALHLEPTSWTALLDEARSTGGLPPDDD